MPVRGLKSGASCPLADRCASVYAQFAGAPVVWCQKARRRMPSTLEPPIFWRAYALNDEKPTEESLQAMGFDVHRLGFYAWLVAHGKEPLVDHALHLSPRRFGRDAGD